MPNQDIENLVEYRPKKGQKDAWLALSSAYPVVEFFTLRLLLADAFYCIIKKKGEAGE